MNIQIELRMIDIPNELPVKAQGLVFSHAGFTGVSYRIEDLTAEQASDYANALAEAFLTKWKQRKEETQRLKDTMESPRQTV